MTTNYSYSFLDVQGEITGLGGSISFGEGGVADEGISIAMDGDIATMVGGADGTPMHSLHAFRGGKVTLRLHKTSPINRFLQTLYNFETRSAANYGQSTISVRDVVRGDAFTCEFCGVSKQPDLTWGKEGGNVEWTFNAGRINGILGSGSPAIS